jgi:hypothetical protein
VLLTAVAPLRGNDAMNEAETRTLHELARYGVAWDQPGRGPQDSMPLGNGDIGLNVWTEDGGDLLFYIAKTDAWDERGELLKLGRVRITTNGPRIGARVPFRQRLDLREAAVIVDDGTLVPAFEARVWVEANRPVVHVELRGQTPFSASAALELWREKDRHLRTDAGALVWYHRNTTSNVVQRLHAHNLGGLEKTYPDPLLHRTFGGRMATADMALSVGPPPADAAPAPLTRNAHLELTVLTGQTATAGMWLEAVETQAREAAAVPLEARRREHAEWWAQFWTRSWVRVESDRTSAEVSNGNITATSLPLRFGADDKGGSTFRGLLARARVLARALSPDEIAAAHESGPDAPAADTTALLGDWRFDTLQDGAIPDRSGAGRHARPRNAPAFAALDYVTGARLDGSQWFEVPDDQKLATLKSLTLEAWIAADELPHGGGRIIDKAKSGTAEGYLLDTYPGNSLRLIMKGGTLSHAAALPPGRWAHVAATFADESGCQRLFVNGRVVREQALSAARTAPEGDAVSQAYVLQRFVSACAGRGAYPIKFNGSLFTVDWPEEGSRGRPDYRLWGPDYWWQNTRLPYWPMLAAGDFDMMRPLFGMYLDTLPLQKERTRRYFDHDGAYYPETMSFWGLSRDEDYGVGNVRKGKPASWHLNGFIRREWQGAIELIAMMLDHYEHTGDDEVLGRELLPLATAVLTFCDLHYKRGADGKIRFEPAQALETWWECVDPMPEIAGLTNVLPRLLQLPAQAVDDDERARWERLLEQLPDLPTREHGGQTVLSPARVFAVKNNCENPELYAIFPYRLFGVQRPRLDMARNSMHLRLQKGSCGWQQDDTQLAMLGLTDEARRFVVRRAVTSYPAARFPAFWGPNFDWIPDQDHCRPCSCSTMVTASCFSPPGRATGTSSSGCTLRNGQRWKDASRTASSSSSA